MIDLSPKHKTEPAVYMQQMNLFSSSRSVDPFTVLPLCLNMTRYKFKSYMRKREKVPVPDRETQSAERKDVFTAHYVWVHIKHATSCSLIVSGEAHFWQVLDKVPGEKVEHDVV